MRWNWILLIVLGSVVVAIVAGFVARQYIRRGLRVPFVVRLINHASDQVIEIIKKPVTLAVLDEVGDVLMAGNYTQNIAAALVENEAELRAMIGEKIKQDQSGRLVRLVPFRDKMIDEAAETGLRIVLAVLDDPRTHELVHDILRDNIEQLRVAVRTRD